LIIVSPATAVNYDQSCPGKKPRAKLLNLIYPKYPERGFADAYHQDDTLPGAYPF